MSVPLNLARRPFRNEALPTLLLGLGILGLMGFTALHLRRIRDLRSERASALERAAADLEPEVARLRQHLSAFRRERPKEGSLARWAALKELVDQRAFSWSELFVHLEQCQPPGVRLLSVAPVQRKGDVEIEISAVARSSEEGLEFVRALEDSPQFADVYPRSAVERSGGRGEFEYRYTMRYRPPQPESNRQ